MEKLMTTRFVADASRETLEAAIASNHRQLFIGSAAALGGEVVEDNGLTYAWSPEGMSNILFPSLAEPGIGAALDRMMDFYRSHQCINIGYWSLVPVQPAATGAYLLARGFQLGWEPYWMVNDLHTWKDDLPLPEGLEVRIDNRIPVSHIKDLPYNDGGTINEAFLARNPGQVQRIVLLRNGEVVAHDTLFFTGGEDGVAGLYNVGVLPSQQRKGYGKAVTAAACRYARERGYRYVTLNANHMGRGAYSQVGFSFIGLGITWWIVNAQYIQQPPAADTVAFIEALCTSNIKVLDQLASHFSKEALNTPHINGMRFMEMATHCKQGAAVEWLAAHGAQFTALDAWNMGWKEKTEALLQKDPEEVNRRYFDWGGNLLHIAVMNDDRNLCKLALAYQVDLNMKDLQYDGIGLGWAYHFNRKEMIMLIEAAMKEKENRS